MYCLSQQDSAVFLDSFRLRYMVYPVQYCGVLCLLLLLDPALADFEAPWVCSLWW